jgi:hypothetical protein
MTDIKRLKSALKQAGVNSGAAPQSFEVVRVRHTTGAPAQSEVIAYC